MKIGIVCYPTFGGSGVVATELGLGLADKGLLLQAPHSGGGRPSPVDARVARARGLAVDSRRVRRSARTDCRSLRRHHRLATDGYRRREMATGNHSGAAARERRCTYL